MASVSFAGHSILIAEDEPLRAVDPRQCFEAVGAYAFTATQFAQALSCAVHSNLSLAVLDYRVGEETNDAVCQHLEARGIPFIFYIGYDDMLRHWPDAVVSKSNPTPRLIEHAAAVLRSHDYSVARRQAPSPGPYVAQGPTTKA